MKITVKVEDIEIIIDRPNFQEASCTFSDQLMNGSILPFLKEACNTAQILLIKKYENKDFI